MDRVQAARRLAIARWRELRHAIAGNRLACWRVLLEGPAVFGGGGGGGGGGGSSARGGGGSKVQPPVVRPGNPPKVETPDPTKGTRPGTEDRRLQDLNEHRRLTEKKADPNAKPPTNPQTPGEKITDGFRKVLEVFDKFKDIF